MNEVDNDRESPKHPNNLSIIDLCNIYLEIIGQSKKHSEDNWNTAIDQLLQIYEDQPDLLKRDTIRLWNEKPDIIISFLARINSTKKTIGMESGLDIKTGDEEASIMNEIDAKLNEEKENAFLKGILSGRIKGSTSY
jgi:hypothetical protein